MRAVMHVTCAQPPALATQTGCTAGTFPCCA